MRLRFLLCDSGVHVLVNCDPICVLQTCFNVIQVVSAIEMSCLVLGRRKLTTPLPEWIIPSSLLVCQPQGRFLFWVAPLATSLLCCRKRSHDCVFPRDYALHRVVGKAQQLFAYPVSVERVLGKTEVRDAFSNADANKTAVMCNLQDSEPSCTARAHERWSVRGTR